MAIKINGQDLKKRYINNQEILRVYKAGVQVRPDTVFDDYFWMEKSSGKAHIYFRYDGWGGTPSASDYPTLEYSFDKETWMDYTITSGATYIEGPDILLEAGDKLYWRNKSATPSFITKRRLYYWTFHAHNQISGNTIKTGGDLTSLICKSGADSLPIYCFDSLFSGFPLESIPKLTATTLGSHCYDNLFQNTNARLDTTQHGEFQYPFRLPYVGTIAGESPIFVRMFKTDGASCPVISPELNTIYYCTMPTY